VAASPGIGRCTAAAGAVPGCPLTWDLAAV